MKKEEFIKKLTVFNSRFYLRFFLLNTLSQIMYNGWWNCICNEEKEEKQKEKCTICKIQIIFTDFENDLEENMFDEEFLNDCNSKLCYHVMELFGTNICAICSFLDSEYSYWGRDCWLGKTWRVPLSKQMKYEEDIKMNQMKKKSLDLSLRKTRKNKKVYLIVYLIMV